VPQGDDNAALSFTLDSVDTAVRHSLGQVRRHLVRCGIADDLCGTVEIALAEALNNVVEHAHASGTHGSIRVEIAQIGAGIHCEIHDAGSPLPGLALPQGMRPPLNAPRADLPEGGFGWYMIRSLTQDLHYSRSRGMNRLGFTVRASSAWADHPAKLTSRKAVRSRRTSFSGKLAIAVDSPISDRIADRVRHHTLSCSCIWLPSAPRLTAPTQFAVSRSPPQKANLRPATIGNWRAAS